MTTWNSRVNLIRDPIESEILKTYNKKPSFKIDPIGKLQIIHALDNGQCKIDVAKEYGVHAHTIAYIYKQKDSIIKKYTQKYNLLNEARGLNLDQSLLDWFKLEIKNGRVVYVDQLKTKAQEIINNLKEKFTCLEDWLSDFKLRHNIAKYNNEIECNVDAKEEWINLLSGLEGNNIYFGGFTALSHRLDFNSYINGNNLDSFISLMFIVNATGTDKRQLAVVGNEPFDADSDIKSLPLDYYYHENAQINNSIIESYLRRWDDELVLKGRHVYLILNVPYNIADRLKLKNIEIISNSCKDFIDKISEKVISCFKNHYRRLYLSQSGFTRDSPLILLDFFHMMSMAWHSVPNKLINRLCFPPNDGSLYFQNSEEDNYENYNLTEWCKENGIPLEAEQSSDTLEKYVFCDDALPCCSWSVTNRITPFINDMLLQRNIPSTSAMEAFQAMKRLVSYLQGEHANAQIMKYAKYLEDHLEYGAILQMHEIAAVNTNETLE